VITTCNDYSEDSLIEQPAIELFHELGWETANFFYEKFGENGTLGRETSSEVVLILRLRATLVRLNLDLLSPKLISGEVDIGIIRSKYEC